MFRKFIASVIVLAVLAGSAWADIPSPYVFSPKHNKKVVVARFEVSQAESDDLALRLSVEAEAPGRCTYSLYAVSGDEYGYIGGENVHCKEGGHTYYISLPHHEDDQVQKYVLTGKFLADRTKYVRFARTGFRKVIIVSSVEGSAHVVIE
ncbi:MAG: hypothetical protein IJS28_04765 [Synergistaceae bacterium]|nr:hypothetical protein [Synergistaceae bacterium]